METLEKTLTRPRRTTPSDFFTTMAGVMLLLVVIGFLPTLYARPLFVVPPIPAYLYVHGIVLTTWFVWFLGQSLLIRARLGGGTGNSAHWALASVRLSLSAA